ncbi:hypothetical protein [Brucella intermedia]|uniref:hypothetical protein n=1 Tax=Brucella intermedia TaxID=94625 RepID=UPI00124EA2FE|nr:hypothetical protein [Brucella intermedia]KAB2708321.1 hypothetical protein F9K80_14600 [Brucella intermedia]
MTLNEFKAWLEGYSASFVDGAPNADQWAKINEKLGSVKMVAEIKPSYAPNPLPRTNEWLPERLFSLGGKDKLVADEINPALVPKVTC